MKYQRGCLFALFFFFLICGFIFGQSAAEEKQAGESVVNVGLSDVDEVYVRVVADKITDIDVHGLEDEISRKLAGDGLKVVSGDISEMDERQKRQVTRLMEQQGRSAGNLRVYSAKVPEVIVRVSVLQGQGDGPCVYHVQTSFARGVYLRSQRFSQKAEVWRIDVPIGIADANGCESAVRTAALGQVDAFAAEWKRANAGKMTGDSEGPKNDVMTPAGSRLNKEEAQVGHTQYKYVASKNSKVFHKPDCTAAKKISDKNLVGFGSRDEATDSGRRPCKICNP